MVFDANWLSIWIKPGDGDEGIFEKFTGRLNGDTIRPTIIEGRLAMSKRESLIGLNSIFRRRSCKAALFSIFLLLVIFGSELTYRYLEPEFIYKTIYASNQYSDKEAGSGEVLKQKILEHYRNKMFLK